MNFDRKHKMAVKKKKENFIKWMKKNIFYLNRWDIIRDKRDTARQQVMHMQMCQERKWMMIKHIYATKFYWIIFTTLVDERNRVFKKLSSTMIALKK
jgi:hypothetical protein